MRASSPRFLTWPTCKNPLCRPFVMRRPANHLARLSLKPRSSRSQAQALARSALVISPRYSPHSELPSMKNVVGQVHLAGQLPRERMPRAEMLGDQAVTRPFRGGCDVRLSRPHSGVFVPASGADDDWPCTMIWLSKAENLGRRQEPG